MFAVLRERNSFGHRTFISDIMFLAVLSLLVFTSARHSGHLGDRLHASSTHPWQYECPSAHAFVGSCLTSVHIPHMNASFTPSTKMSTGYPIALVGRARAAINEDARTKKEIIGFDFLIF
jgi:hypothetical protein